MRNIEDVLRAKENEIEKLTREIKLLRVAARMLEGQNHAVRAVEAGAELPAVTLDDRVLDVAPAPAPPNGDIKKRWP
jgi:hypothetical protein